MTTADFPKALSRDQMAARLARDIPEGWYVNLGIGIPTRVADFVPRGREVIFQSENGVLGFGQAPPEGMADPWLINAGKQPITLRPGGAFVHQADSFAMIRGGHLDLCVLGAFQVDQAGGIANWATTATTDVAPAVGGAMDLAASAKRLWVLMEHLTKDGQPRLVKRCSYPLTAPAAVTRVYTNIAVFDVTPAGFVLVESLVGLSSDQLQAMTDARIVH
jgi:3-oxoadipate CoA-transferase beta subunit